MPTADVQYVLWVSRRRRGRHGSAAMDIYPPSRSILTAGDLFHPGWALPRISWPDSAGNTRQARFAFWSVTGGIGGATATTENQSPTAQVGSENIIARAWYIEGGDGNGSGVEIDAFDVNHGTFFDAEIDFVTVEPDARLTASANADGWVPTNSTQNVIAQSLVGSVPFQDWMVVIGNEMVSDNQLQAAAGTSAIAFAFYKSPSLEIRPFREVPPWRVIVGNVPVDGGGGYFDALGRFHPIPPWDPTLLLQVAAGLRLAEMASQVSPELQAGVFELAMKQVHQSNEAIIKSLQAGFGSDVIKDTGKEIPK